MDHTFKLAYTIKTTTSCMVHRYNVNANTRNTHMNHKNANASTSAGKRNGKKVFLHFHGTFIYTCEPGQCKHKCKCKVKKHRFHWFHVTMALWKRLGLCLCIFPSLYMNWMCERGLLLHLHSNCPCVKHVNQALGSQRFYQVYRDANLWRSKIWRLSFLHFPTPNKWTQPPIGKTKDIIWSLTWSTCYQNSQSSFLYQK